MLRLMATLIGLTLLTGCSELKIIGSAAVRELKAEGINVEAVSFRYHQKLAEAGKVEGVMVAAAEAGRLPADRPAEAGPAKAKVAKQKRVKGLWESN